MKINGQLTDEAVLRELGARIAALRLARNLTQAALAEQAGVSKRTLERLESGVVAAQLSAFLRVCRVLGLLEQFDAFVPEPAPSPLAQLKLQGQRRQRASRKKAPLGISEKKWRWGDES
ncbi:MAG: helix-turn-helix domain-containing protein [Pseudomonadota bacterium]|nr:helix-turn-helix domain-containing protein [Pseudomonadota bacterium]